MAATRPSASEQEARDATVRATGIAEDGYRRNRRQLLLGVAGLGLTSVTAWLGIAATKDFWPFGSASASRRTVGEIDGDLPSGRGERRQVAVAELARRSSLGDPDREAAVAALARFLRGDHATIRSAGIRDPSELSDAFMALGRANVATEVADFRYADLAGLDVRDIAFPDGLALFQANLRNLIMTGADIGGGNMQEARLDNAWLGGCRLTRWFLGHASLLDVYAPGTTFTDRIFAGADVTKADFSKSVFVNCDFDGRMLIRSAQYDPIHWDSGRPPRWPVGFKSALH
ncbi:pentapeptide repeat-containing protein [Kribbella solani]|uniref:pentapeptide repeat-containing protein n=1 Tax=Kribbella solani TaxID=236067 RepID=UPI0029AF57DB|nr:pentapeptide repeat-containing protein [Kribbella solani]MDX3002039.1 pentapeptide repeat-containing protein [Kribbella solani]